MRKWLARLLAIALFVLCAGSFIASKKHSAHPLASTHSEPPASEPRLSALRNQGVAPLGAETNDLARKYFAEVRSDPDYDWKRAIHFFGKVVDQHGKPIEGALIRASWTDLSPSGGSRTNQITDAQGRFEIHGIAGKALSVVPEKAGFERYRDVQISFEYAQPFASNFHVPDAKSPVTFKLFRRNINSPQLLVGKIEREFERNGETYLYPFSLPSHFDIGPLRVKAKLSESGQSPRTWETEFEIENAELQLADDEFAPFAPIEGYKRSYVQTLVAEGAGREPLFEKTFYFHSGPSRSFGKIKLRFSLKGQLIRISYAVNPAGERNLELIPGTVW